MLTKSEYKQYLTELIKEMPELGEGSNEECLYQIDDLCVYGAFQHGYRNIDHTILLTENINWDLVLSYGTLIVPETETYISDTPIATLNELGFVQLPLNSNHIVGFRTLEHLEQGVDIDPYC